MRNPEEVLQKSWKDTPRAGHVLVPGNTEVYNTGAWGTFKPVLNEETCIHCLQCWVLCPDSAILVENDKLVGFSELHCKGCGICAEVCPDKYKSITMVKKEE